MKKEQNLYKIGELAKLCGVTVRTLQIYDEKGLLVPGYIADSVKRGYRIVDTPRYNYVNGAWNQRNPEKWLTIIQVPVEGGEFEDDCVLCKKGGDV